MYADRKFDPNIEIFETEEQENDNIIITSHIQSINNTYEDEQVCICDYLDYSERFLWGWWWEMRIMFRKNFSS